jgi:alpha-mannosidase
LSADYWTELRGANIILDQEAKSETQYLVAIHLFHKVEPVDVPSISVTYSYIEKMAFELGSFIQELRFSELLDEDVTEQVSEEFNFEVFEKKLSEIFNEIEKTRAKLFILSQKAKEFKVHLVAHAHIDMNWLWPYDDTVATIKDTFSTMVKLMTKYPDFHFSQSQAVTYKIVEEKYQNFLNQ